VRCGVRASPVVSPRSSFNEIWLDGEKAKTEEYWQAPLVKEWGEGGIDKLMRHDNGRGIITGHEVEPPYCSTYEPAPAP